MLLNAGYVNQRTIYTEENAIPNVLGRHTLILLTVDAKTVTQPAQHAHQAIPAIHAKISTTITITRNVERLAQQEQELIQLLVLAFLVWLIAQDVPQMILVMNVMINST